MSTEIITVDGEVVDETPQAPITLFGTDHPREVIERATAVASALKDVINQRHLISRIQGRDHVQVEGWTLLGSMVGVFAEIEWTRPIDGGWEARAIARTLSGRLVGAAEAMCTAGERTWRGRDQYAIRSMAQTRAVSKALRLPLGFIVELAGYSATPAEELNEQPGRGEQVAGPSPATMGAPADPDPASRSEAFIIAERYAWAERHGWDTSALDEWAEISTGEKVPNMDSITWQVFAASIKSGPPEPAAAPPAADAPAAGSGADPAPAEPPKPGTDEYKALKAPDKALARAHWAEKEREAREPEPMTVPEQEPLPISS